MSPRFMFRRVRPVLDSEKGEVLRRGVGTLVKCPSVQWQPMV